METTNETSVGVKSAELTVVESRLVDTIEQAHLEPATAQGLLDTFRPLFAKAHEICATAANLAVTDATQVTEIKQARALRLALRSVRVEADKTRKTLKEDSLRRSKAIDGVYNVLEYAVSPVESRLLGMEEIAERAEAARKAALKSMREELLKPFGIDVSFYSLGQMSEQAFAQLLENTRVAHEAKREAQRKAEEEWIAREKAEMAERARIREENERLKREADEREAAAKVERERAAKEKAAAEASLKAERERVTKEQEAAAATARAERQAVEAKAANDLRVANEKARKEKAALEAKAKADREARERLEAEARDRREAEEKRQREEAEAAALAAAAPDGEKLRAFAALVRTLELPEMGTKTGGHAAETVAELVSELATKIEGIASKLGRRAA